MATVTVENLSKDIIYGATGVEEVIQNVRTILSTRKGTVPLDRDFGIASEFLDNPLPQARAEISTDVFEQIRRYEPRAQLKEIAFDIDPINGRITPKVKVEVVNVA
jgi:phage baseplate assembly protein W